VSQTTAGAASINVASSGIGAIAPLLREAWQPSARSRDSAIKGKLDVELSDEKPHALADRNQPC
jgi:hypothetical protein